MHRSACAMGTLSATFVIALSGCGAAASNPKSSSSSSPPATSSGTSAAPAPNTTFAVFSEAFQAGRPIAEGESAMADRFTCDGGDISPPIKWSGVAAGTAELMLFIIDMTSSQTGHKRTFSWAVAGLRPTLEGLTAGALPTGAIVAGQDGTGQGGYSICPPRGQLHNYAVLLFALRHRLGLRPGFDPNAAYMKIARTKLPQAQSGFAYLRK
jgi:phosphatidylethanolamine-binding protein (PEBP) family uncharacterized protein